MCGTPFSIPLQEKISSSTAEMQEEAEWPVPTHREEQKNQVGNRPADIVSGEIQ